MAKSKSLDPEAPLRIRQWRESMGWERSELASKLGMKGKTAVSNWELGVNEPSKDAYRRLGKLADFPANRWFFIKAGLSLSEIERLQPSSASQQPVEHHGNAGLDRDLLVEIIVAVAEELKVRGKILSIEKQAELISLLYEYCVETGTRDSRMTARMVSIA
jgi:transcriptional regulator with XRE-family HTH domain